MQTESVTFFHVMRQNHLWHIKEDNGGSITACPSKEEAIQKATELALATSKTDRRRLIIHKTNGAHELVRDIN